MNPELPAQGGQYEHRVQRWRHGFNNFAQLALRLSGPNARYEQKLYWESLQHSFPDDAEEFLEHYPDRRMRPLIEEIDTNIPT